MFESSFITHQHTIFVLLLSAHDDQIATLISITSVNHNGTSICPYVLSHQHVTHQLADSAHT